MPTTSYPMSPIRAIAIILAYGALRSMRTRSTGLSATLVGTAAVTPPLLLGPLPLMPALASGIHVDTLLPLTVALDR